MQKVNLYHLYLGIVEYWKIPNRMLHQFDYCFLRLRKFWLTLPTDAGGFLGRLQH